MIFNAVPFPPESRAILEDEEPFDGFTYQIEVEPSTEIMVVRSSTGHTLYTTLRELEAIIHETYANLGIVPQS